MRTTLHRWRSLLALRAALVVALLPALALTVACERSTSPSQDSTVVARLVSTHTDDGAALVELTGDVQSVSASSGTVIYSEQTAAGVMRLLVIRDTPGRIEFSLQLADRSKRPTARVLQVADGADQPRADVSGYRVEY